MQAIAAVRQFLIVLVARRALQLPEAPRALKRIMQLKAAGDAFFAVGAAGARSAAEEELGDGTREVERVLPAIGKEKKKKKGKEKRRQQSMHERPTADASIKPKEQSDNLIYTV